MKIIIISDIHGNIAALDAINEKADLVLCLGDVVNYGPYPKECIERVKNLTDKIVRGNHDNAVGKNLPIILKVEIKVKIFLLSHASPGGDMYKYIRPETADKDLKLEINDIEADVVFIGHTHL
ncbi:MAG: metallophosphoesterase family protein, partial [Candidatus Brocadiales bacterium]|nr:metallophosphoesterase family protein [Candidatus Brocadiales bacterium]